MSDIAWSNDTRRLSELTPWADNPAAIGHEEAARLLESLRSFGQVATIAIEPDGMICDGHQRRQVWAAAQEFGPDFEVAVRVANRKLTRKEREKLAVLLRTAQGHFDWDKLAAWDTEELTGWGLDAETLTAWNDDAANLREMLAAREAEAAPVDAGAQVDRAEELLAVWGVKAGDVWEIPSKTANGVHRVVCGDCTDKAVVEKCLQGDKPTMMVTDPPYGIEHDTSWREDAGISQAGPQSAKGIDWDENADWREAYCLVKVDVAYVWHATCFNRLVADGLESAGFEIKQQVIWNKTVAAFGRSHYSYKHEPCWYAVRKGKTACWIGPNNEVTVWDIASPHHIMGGSKEEKQPHSTQKPLECMERPIRNHDAPIVYDPFLGSGTTLVACERQGRLGRGIEIAPEYVAVTLQRLQDLGLAPVKVNDGRPTD